MEKSEELRNLNHEVELMTITAEECAEVIQELCKIIRFGASEENLQRLEKEFGDLLCMYQLLEDNELIDVGRVAIAASNKKKKLAIWSNLKL